MAKVNVDNTQLSKPKTKKIARWYFGGLGSAGAACCTHPLDLLKVILPLPSLGLLFFQEHCGHRVKSCKLFMLKVDVLLTRCPYSTSSLSEYWHL